MAKSIIEIEKFNDPDADACQKCNSHRTVVAGRQEITGLLDSTLGKRIWYHQECHACKYIWAVPREEWFDGQGAGFWAKDLSNKMPHGEDIWVNNGQLETSDGVPVDNYGRRINKPKD